EYFVLASSAAYARHSPFFAPVWPRPAYGQETTAISKARNMSRRITAIENSFESGTRGSGFGARDSRFVLMRAQVFRKERQHLLLQALGDAIAVIAFIGLERVGDAEGSHALDEQLVAGDQIILEADVERDGLHPFQMGHILIEHRDR